VEDGGREMESRKRMARSRSRRKSKNNINEIKEIMNSK
jgi:hypothetical protein